MAPDVEEIIIRESCESYEVDRSRGRGLCLRRPTISREVLEIGGWGTDERPNAKTVLGGFH